MFALVHARGTVVGRSVDRNSGKEDHDATQPEPNVTLMNITGKVMRGWALVEPAGIQTSEQLNAWVRRAAKFAASLPAK